jgi:DinB superfamily
MDEQVDGQAVRRDVLIALEYSYNEDDWVYPLADALAGVTAQEAAWKPGPDVRSIWEIVLHMTVWTDNIVQRREQRMRGEPPGGPPEGSWPPPPAIPDETAWEGTMQRLWEALAGLRAHIEATPLAVQLDCEQVGYSQFADLLCRFIHNAYHIGQITKLRECRAAQSVAA